MSIIAMKQALEAHKKNESHRTVAETRYWCEQYKLLAEQAIEQAQQAEQPKVRTGNCLRVGVCASEGHKIAPPRQPLTAEEIGKVAAPYYGVQGFRVEAFARAIETAHGIKEEA